MAMRGKPSEAHEFDKSNQCIHCGMYENSVRVMNHACIDEREKEWDDSHKVPPDMRRWRPAKSLAELKEKFTNGK